MSTTIQRAAVIGSGIMGAGIAAHLANGGVEVLLLDLPAHPARNQLAEDAKKHLLRQKPSPIYSSEVLELIEVGNTEDDLYRVAEVDWIVEAVIENLQIKKDLLEQVERYWSSGTVVSSNTSGISVNRMVEGRSEEFRQHFLGAHFFNPPRYMKLLELIPTMGTDPKIVKRLGDFCEEQLGKGIVHAKDTPNFIANRIGTYGLLVTLQEMREQDLSVSAVDFLTGPLLGRPKSATFRTLDLVGLDTFLHVVENVRSQAEDQQERSAFTVPKELKELVRMGRLGEKSGKGFYEARKSADGKEILQLDFSTMNYMPKDRVSFVSVGQAKNAQSLSDKLQILIHAKDAAGKFVWSILKKTLLYAANKIPEIADDCSAIDRAMCWGFNWDAGPFEIWDAIGLEKSVQRMEAEGEQVPLWIKEMLASGQKRFYESSKGERDDTRPKNQVSLSSFKEKGNVILKNNGATLIDLDDDVACLEFTSPKNAIGPEILHFMYTALDEVQRNYRGLVIGNEGKNFCVGANLMLLLMEAQDENWHEIERMIRQFQDVSMAMKYFEKPIVSAPFGMTLGGGVEISIPAARVQASAETYMGLVEAGVGLIPAGGGTKELLVRFTEHVDFDGKIDLQPHVNRAFETIGMAKVSTSALEAVKLGFLRESDGITMNRDHQLWDAKQAVIGMSIAGYKPSRHKRIRVVGKAGLAVMKMGIYQLRCSDQISDHDSKIAGKLAHVLTGGNVSANTTLGERDLLDLEREAFLSLCGESKSQARMQHMLLKGKPLRN